MHVSLLYVSKMNSINTLPYFYSSSSPHYFFSKKYPLWKFPQNSFSIKRRRSRHPRRNKFNYKTIKPSLVDDNYNNNYYNNNNKNNQNVKLVVDVNQISLLVSSKFDQLLSQSKDAYQDLKTLISFDENNRILFSCQKSTLQFTGAVLVWGFVLVSTFKFLIKLVLGFKRKLGVLSKPNVVVRRDRSLGGREVVVGTNKRVEERGDVKRKGFRVLNLERHDWSSYWRRSEAKVPKWWPVSAAVEDRFLGVNQEEYQREANRLIRAITDHRTRGKDFMEDDIIQLRRICRTSGVHAFFDTKNTRDAFYRASIDFVLNVCGSASSYPTFILIDGEDAQQFIAGLAENVGLENIRAARMVSAAVAARTRSCFLQAWALEMQGKHYEAELELTKTCCFLRTFPPEESSPEMEMVARGLGKHLKVEQREFLMNKFVAVCCEESHRIAAEALGLMLNSKGVGDQQNSKHT